MGTNITDLREIGNPNSLLRQILRENGDIDLHDFDLSLFDYTGFNIDYFKLPSTNNQEAPLDIRQTHLDTLINKLKQENIELDKETGAISEMIRNAQEHGNKFDINKSIGLGYKKSKDILEIFVEDQGGILNQDFLPYVLFAQRALQVGENIVGFYQFSQKEILLGHSGVGTLVAHSVLDNIEYHKSKLGGLLVNMVKRL